MNFDLSHVSSDSLRSAYKQWLIDKTEMDAVIHEKMMTYGDLIVDFDNLRDKLETIMNNDVGVVIRKFEDSNAMLVNIENEFKKRGEEI